LNCGLIPFSLPESCYTNYIATTKFYHFFFNIMDFTTTPASAQALTYEEAITVIVHNKMTDLLIRSCFASYLEQQPRKDVSYSEAMRVFRQHASAEITDNAYPPHVVNTAASVAPITITPTAITVKLDNHQKELKYNSGSYVTIGTTASPSLRSHVADAIAYVYTPREKLTTVATVQSNFGKVSNADALIGIPQIATATNVHIAVWSTNAQKNAETVYTATKAPAALAQYASLTKPIATQLAENNKVQSVSSAGYLTLYKQGAKTKSTDEEAYKILNIHRAYRGEDAKFVSSLTSAYYMGGLSRSLVMPYMYVVDIGYVATSLNATCVILDPTFSPVVARSLASSGLRTILMTTVGSALYTKSEIQDWAQTNNGTYLALDVSQKVMPTGALHVRMGQKASHQYKTTGVVETTTMAGVKSLFAALPGTHVMTWWGITKPMLAYCSTSSYMVMDSIHVHAGHMIVVKSKTALDLPKQYDHKRHIGRFITSNVYKTHFPLSHMRFYELDCQVFKYNNPFINQVILNLGITRKEKVELRLDDYGGDENVDLGVDEHDYASAVHYTGKTYTSSPFAFEQPPLTPQDTASLFNFAVPTSTATTTVTTTATTTTTTQATFALGQTADADDQEEEVLLDEYADD